MMDVSTIQTSRPKKGQIEDRKWVRRRLATGRGLPYEIILPYITV